MQPISPRIFICKNGAKVVIRCAATSDAEGLFMHARQLLADGEGQVRTSKEASEVERTEWIAKHQENTNWLLVVAESEGAIIGCIDFSNGELSRLEHRGVLGMGVSPMWRGQGIGRRLLETLVEWAIEKDGLEKLCLAVLSTNAKAIALYKKMGFQEEGRRVREVKYDDGSYADDILMYRFV